jgi:hypothetical protein
MHSLRRRRVDFAAGEGSEDGGGKRRRILVLPDRALRAGERQHAKSYNRTRDSSHRVQIAVDYPLTALPVCASRPLIFADLAGDIPFPMPSALL